MTAWIVAIAGGGGLAYMRLWYGVVGFAADFIVLGGLFQTRFMFWKLGYVAVLRALEVGVAILLAPLAPGPIRA